MRLHLYFARRYLFTFLAVLAVFFLILSLFDLLEQIRRYGDEVSFRGILALTFLNVPKSLYRILPLITIIASIFLFLALARSSELVVARAAGRSILVTLIAPVLVAFALGGLAVAVFNPIVAATLKQYEALVDRYSAGGSSVLSISREGLWLRQGDETGQTVIRAQRASLDGTEMTGATFLSFDPEGRPVTRIEAERARLVPGAWELENAKLWPLGTSENPERDSTRHETLRLASNLTPDEILDSFGDPAAVQIWDLPAFIARLETAGFSGRVHRVWYQMELSLPVLLAAMTLVGAGFTMRHARFGRTGVMVMLALGTGFALYFVRNFAQILGENGQIPILLAAWAPAAAAFLLPVGLILHLEDG
jgi:lipopolysaccharide export system permease protein